MSTNEYRSDLINAAMGAKRMTSVVLAERAGLSVGTVSAIRNGKSSVEVPTLRRVAEALGLTMAELFTPAPDSIRLRRVAA